MKKFLAILMALVLGVLFCSCGTDKKAVDTALRGNWTSLANGGNYSFAEGEFTIKLNEYDAETREFSDKEITGKYTIGKDKIKLVGKTADGEKVVENISYVYNKDSGKLDLYPEEDKSMAFYKWEY